MRGWVGCLQLVLVLDSAVILGSVSRGTHDYMSLSQIRVSTNLEVQVPIFIFKNAVPTVQKTQYVSIIKNNRRILFL
jgi:hypothetical protein